MQQHLSWRIQLGDKCTGIVSPGMTNILSYQNSILLQAVSFAEYSFPIIGLLKADDNRWPAPHICLGALQAVHLVHGYLSTYTKLGSDKVWDNLNQDVSSLFLLHYTLLKRKLRMLPYLLNQAMNKNIVVFISCKLWHFCIHFLNFLKQPTYGHSKSCNVPSFQANIRIFYHYKTKDLKILIILTRNWLKFYKVLNNK